MARGTLIVSRYTNWFPFFKTKLEALGYEDIRTTDKDKDALNMFINEIKPKIVLIDSFFYSGATPYMVYRLVNSFRRIRFSVVSIGMFPDNRAAMFIFYGAKSYIKLSDGPHELILGLKCIQEGKQYIAPHVQNIINNYPEIPEINNNVEKRQIEVLILLCAGKTQVEIAEKMHISRRTVEYHIGRLLTVFNVNNTAALVAIAIYLDIVTKNDLCFFDREIKKIDLPQWAVVQREINGIAKDSELSEQGYEYS
jgi:DNA-binding NarL/FixJ family response regulator